MPPRRTCPKAKPALASPTTSGACRSCASWASACCRQAPVPRLAAARYAINRFFGPVPMHLVGCGLTLDRRAAGVRGAAAANPHGLVQEFLNRSPGHLWAHRLERPAPARPARQPGPVAPVVPRVRSRGDVRRRGLFRLRPALADGPRHALCAARGRQTGDAAGWSSGPRWPRSRAPALWATCAAASRGRLQILGEGFTSHPKNTALRDALANGTAAARRLSRPAPARGLSADLPVRRRGPHARWPVAAAPAR